MTSRTRLISGICIAGSAMAIIPIAHADPFLPVPPASFLNYHVSTARGLSEEVAQDVVVRARLARHFGMSEPALVAYVKTNLVVSHLTAAQAGRYRIACVSPSGREYFVSEKLPAGTPVFALAKTGQPILRLACGNPLVSTLPAVAKAIAPPVLAVSRHTPDVVPVPEELVDSQVAARETAFNIPRTDQIGPITQVGGMVQSLGPSRGLGLVPAAVGLIGFSTLHHGHSSPPVPLQPAVPEPSTLALFGGFAIAMLALQARRRKSRESN